MGTQPLEPWLRGPIPAAEPLVAPMIASYQDLREDLARHTQGLSDSQVWEKLGGIPSLGFQLRRIAGIVDRLTP